MASRLDLWKNWNLTYAPEAYGPLMGAQSVQEEVYATIQYWIPAYIAAFNRMVGATALKPIFEYRHKPDYQTNPKTRGAAVLVEVPNTVGIPEVQGADGIIRSDWRVEVMVYYYGTQDWQDTQATCNAYEAMIRGLLVQNPGLQNGFTSDIKWLGSEYIEHEHTATRTVGVAHIRFNVTLPDTMRKWGGPPNPAYAPEGAITTPTTDPLPGAPTVDQVDVTLQKEPLDA